MLLWNGMGYQRNSNGYSHIFDHARTSGGTADVVRHQRTTDFKMAESKPEVECFFRTGKEEDITRIIIMCQRVVILHYNGHNNYLSLFPSKCFISPLFGHIGGHLGFLKCHVTNAKWQFCRQFNAAPNTFYRASMSLTVYELHDVEYSGV